MMKKIADFLVWSFVVFVVFFSCISQAAGKKIQVLIVDGQNNHTVWPKSTQMMKRYLEETGLFSVDIYRTQFTWKGGEFPSLVPLNDGKHYQDVQDPVTDDSFAPKFKKYQVIVSNFGWKAADWPAKTQAAFESYMRKGGGLVVVHSADNCFPSWFEYNDMIALGGWGDRTEKNGPYVYFTDEHSEPIRDLSPGSAGSHGARKPFLIQVRDKQHPITQGLPEKWLHVEDELYAKLRGPAKNLTILATAFSDPSNKGTGRHEPILMAIDYFKGRIFHTTLGHDAKAFEGVGFITTLTRGAEWAATGKVTQAVPSDFPTHTNATSRSFVN